jgi:hypothetical protein
MYLEIQISVNGKQVFDQVYVSDKPYNRNEIIKLVKRSLHLAEGALIVNE